jgi:protein-S-isoprenylcysteine O-methyltransferase Ste14
LSGWLGNRYPGLDLFAHNTGHLWNTLLGLKGDAHFSAIHLSREGLIVGGFVLIGAAWKVLYRAQRMQQLATTGPYAILRHPQYTGFILIMLGFLIQWPTLVTLVMFPILVMMYVRLAKREEQEALAQFGEGYLIYAAKIPAFLPRLTPPLPDGRM